MTTYRDLKVGDRLNICVSIADFCGLYEQGLFLKSNDISLAPAPCTIISAMPGCLNLDGVGIRARFARISGSAQCNSCTPVEDYTELGMMRANSAGTATLSYVVTEKDLADYKKALATGDSYKLVTCITDPLGQPVTTKGACSVALTVSSGVHPYELRINFRKTSWATESQTNSTVETLLPAINALITPLGYTYLGKNINWQESYISLYYKGNSPAIPLGAIVLTILGLLLGIGIITVGLAWLTEAQTAQKIAIAKIDAEKAAMDVKTTADADAKADYDSGKTTWEQYQQQLGLNQARYKETLDVIDDYYAEQDLSSIIQTVVLAGIVLMITYFIFVKRRT